MGGWKLKLNSPACFVRLMQFIPHSTWSNLQTQGGGGGGWRAADRACQSQPALKLSYILCVLSHWLRSRQVSLNQPNEQQEVGLTWDLTVVSTDVEMRLDERITTEMWLKSKSPSLSSPFVPIYRSECCVNAIKIVQNVIGITVSADVCWGWRESFPSTADRHSKTTKQLFFCRFLYSFHIKPSAKF